MAGAWYFWGVPIPAHEPGPDGDEQMKAGNSEGRAVSHRPALTFLLALYPCVGRLLRPRLDSGTLTLRMPGKPPGRE
jgi:hypothetical protein